MILKAEVTYADELKNYSIQHEQVFVFAEEMGDAVEKITKYYDNIESIYIEYFSPDSLLIFRGENKQLFDEVVKALEPEILW